MTIAQRTSKPISHTNNKRTLSLLLLPLVSCVFSSVVGIILGQIGNLFYKILGEVGNLLALPGFFILFLVTFGLSFLSSRLLRKWLVDSRKQEN